MSATKKRLVTALESHMRMLRKRKLPSVAMMVASESFIAGAKWANPVLFEILKCYEKSQAEIDK